MQLPLVPESAWYHIADRLATILPADISVQQDCSIPFGANGREDFWAIGIADAVKDEIVYELKFVDELAHKHFLQCAMYMIGLGLEKGILWNVRTNQQYEIRIPNAKAFMDKVSAAVTKGKIIKYGFPLDRPSEGAERAAFDYKEIFAQFVAENQAACDAVFKRTEYAAKAKLPFGAIAIERAFAEQGVEIPLVPKTFQRHWKAYCADRKKQKRPSKKSA